MRQICFVSLFPGYFEAAMRSSVIGRAVAAGLIDWRFVQIRDFSTDRHHRVDDAPYGGGAGLVMKPEPVVAAIEHARGLYTDAHVVLMSPQGARFDQRGAARLSRCGTLVLVCGHYEGVDERVRAFVDEEISVGDFILTGGELAALAVSDAVCRLWPGVLGNDDSSTDESFADGWLEYPQYTRPPEFRGMRVPEILLGGDHGAVDRWRRCRSVVRTRQRRPDIYETLEPTLTAQERKWLEAHGALEDPRDDRSAGAPEHGDN